MSPWQGGAQAGVFCVSSAPDRDGAPMLLRDFLCGNSFMASIRGISAFSCPRPRHFVGYILYPLHPAPVLQGMAAFIRAGLSLLPAFQPGCRSEGRRCFVRQDASSGLPSRRGVHHVTFQPAVTRCRSGFLAGIVRHAPVAACRAADGHGRSGRCCLAGRAGRTCRRHSRLRSQPSGALRRHELGIQPGADRDRAAHS